MSDEERDDHYGGLVVAAYLIVVLIVMVLFILAMYWLAGIAQMPMWEKVSGEASMLIKYRQTIAGVEASWWAVGKSPQEIEAEARKRLIEELQQR